MITVSLSNKGASWDQGKFSALRPFCDPCRPWNNLIAFLGQPKQNSLGWDDFQQPDSELLSSSPMTSFSVAFILTLAKIASQTA